MNQIMALFQNQCRNGWFTAQLNSLISSISCASSSENISTIDRRLNLRRRCRWRKPQEVAELDVICKTPRVMVSLGELSVQGNCQREDGIFDYSKNTERLGIDYNTDVTRPILHKNTQKYTKIHKIHKNCEIANLQRFFQQNSFLSFTIKMERVLHCRSVIP